MCFDLLRVVDQADALLLQDGCELAAGLRVHDCLDHRSGGQWRPGSRSGLGEARSGRAEDPARCSVTIGIVLLAGGVEYSFSNQEEIWLGRADTADVRLSNPHVSRRHGRLTLTADGWLYEDAHSTHGTRYRGSRITRLPLVKPVTLLLGEPGRGEEV